MLESYLLISLLRTQISSKLALAGVTSIAGVAQCSIQSLVAVGLKRGHALKLHALASARATSSTQYGIGHIVDSHTSMSASAADVQQFSDDDGDDEPTAQYHTAPSSPTVSHCDDVL